MWWHWKTHQQISEPRKHSKNSSIKGTYTAPSILLEGTFCQNASIWYIYKLCYIWRYKHQECERPIGPHPTPTPKHPQSTRGGGGLCTGYAANGRSIVWLSAKCAPAGPTTNCRNFWKLWTKKKHDHNILCQRMNGSLEVPPWNPLECTWRKWIQTSTISSTVKKVVPESLAEGWFDTRNTNWRREGPRTECSLFWLIRNFQLVRQWI